MSNKIRVGDIVQFNYGDNNKWSWNGSWRGATLEIIDIKDKSSSPWGHIVIRLIDKTSETSLTFERGFISNTSYDDLDAYILIKRKSLKSHLPVWW